MSSEEKKVYLSLLVILFNYHGLSDIEQQILGETASKIEAVDELQWVKDYALPSVDITYDKIKAYINSALDNYTEAQKLTLLGNVWNTNMQKGYVSEMEATAMLMLAKEWKVQKEFILHIRENKKTS